MKLFLLALGYVISIGSGVLLYLRGEKPIDSIAMTLLISTLTTLIRVLVDIDKNHDELLEACGISKYLNKDDKLKDALYKLPEDYIAATSKSHDKLFVEVAKTTLDQCVEKVAELANGKFKVEEDKRLHYMFSKIDETKNGSIKVVTWLSQGTSKTHWWNGSRGKKYLQKQKEAIQNRNVEITRIFITSNQAVSDLRHLISDQIEIGIKVMTVRENSLPDDLLANFLICNDNWVTESEFNRHGKSKRGIISINYEADILPRIKKWERLSNHNDVTEIHNVNEDIF